MLLIPCMALHKGQLKEEKVIQIAMVQKVGSASARLRVVIRMLLTTDEMDLIAPTRSCMQEVLFTNSAGKVHNQGAILLSVTLAQVPEQSVKHAAAYSERSG